jgi:hypothetical protein
MNKKTVLEWFDFVFNKLIPKKLLVWLIATILVFMGKLTADLWAYLSMAYLGTNVLQKFTGKKTEL